MAVILIQSYSKVGYWEGDCVGILVGSCDVGRNVGLGDGMNEGLADGVAVGTNDGDTLGADVGNPEGLRLGDIVGKLLGYNVGSSVSNISQVSKLLDVSTRKGSCVMRSPLEYIFQSYIPDSSTLPL